MPMFMSEGHMEEDVCTAKPYFQPNNQIGRRDVQLRYFPSADPGLFVVVHVYIFRYQMNSSLSMAVLWLSAFKSSVSSPTVICTSSYNTENNKAITKTMTTFITMTKLYKKLGCSLQRMKKYSGWQIK